MNAIIKAVLSLYIFLYRITSGAIGGRMANLSVLLLTTIGRKSGQARTRPLGYFKHGDKFVVIASNGGSDRSPAWFYNLISNPQVTIQVGDKQMAARAEVAEPELRKQLWDELVKMAPRYAKYEQSTKREIPLVLLQPA
jgi:F420H(2)-dependent quinone reductase